MRENLLVTPFRALAFQDLGMKKGIRHGKLSCSLFDVAG